MAGPDFPSVPIAAMEQWCLPKRRQQDGTSRAAFAEKAGAISGKLSRASNSDASARRIRNEGLESLNHKNHKEDSMWAARLKTIASTARVLSALFTAAVVCAPAQPGSGPRGAVLRDEIIAQERAGLDSLKSGNLAPFNASIAEEAVFVDAHGPADKAQVMKNTAGFRLTDYTISDIHFVPLSAKSGLIVYHMTESGNSHGRDFTAKVYVSSIWIRRKGKWLCVFSQETTAK